MFFKRKMYDNLKTWFFPFYSDIVDHTKVKVRCGEWDTQQQIEPQKHIDRFAKHISIHPAFDSKNLQNDFALIHLKEEFPLSQHINTMCLPDPFYAEEEFDDDETSYDTSDCFATGWGKFEPQKGC